MNKRQAKKYFKQINNTVEQHNSGSISNTKRIKHYTTMKPARFRPISNKFPKRLLRKRGVNIDSHRTTVRVVVDAVETGGKWYIFKTTIPDQVKAGQFEYVENGEIKHE